MSAQLVDDTAQAIYEAQAAVDVPPNMGHLVPLVRARPQTRKHWRQIARLLLGYVLALRVWA